eukprot:UN08051
MTLAHKAQNLQSSVEAQSAQLIALGIAVPPLNEDGTFAETTFLEEFQQKQQRTTTTRTTNKIYNKVKLQMLIMIIK